jgi:hypothetical protein
MVGLGVPLNDVVRFFNQPIFLHLAKEGKYNIDKVNLLSKKLLTNWITEDKTIFEEEIKELNKLNLQFINTPKANTELKESIRTKISELTDRMQSKGIKLLEEGYFVTSQMLEETTKNYYRNNENFDSVKGFDALVQLIVINDFRKLNVIGKRVFSASLVSNMLREIPSDYAVLSRMIDTVNDEISDIGWDDYAKEIKEAEKELKDSATYKEKKKALQNSEEYKNATTQEKRSMTYDLIQNSLSRDKAEAIFRDRRRLLNSILSFTSSDYNRASEKWPFINSSLLANPNWKEAYRQLIRVKALFQTMFFKHHRNIEEFVNNAIKYLGVEYQGSDDKYDIIEKAKTQFMNFIATKMYINLGSKETPFYSSMGIDENIKASYDIKLPGGNVATKSLYGLPAFTHLLVNRLNALAKHLSTTGKDNYFLSNLEFYFDSSSNMNKIIFTQDKMQDAVESSKFKRAFLELANEDIKAWEEGTRKQQ